MSDEELSARIEGISVFALVEHLHKLRIVEAMKSKGYTVAIPEAVLDRANVPLRLGNRGPGRRCRNAGRRAAQVDSATHLQQGQVAAVQQQPCLAHGRPCLLTTPAPGSLLVAENSSERRLGGHFLWCDRIYSPTAQKGVYSREVQQVLVSWLCFLV